MKPYEFYKKSANLKQDPNDETKKVSTAHNGFSFYDGDLKLDYLNYASPYDPSLNFIRAKQWESARALVEQGRQTVDSDVVQEIYNLFTNHGDEIVKDLNNSDNQKLKISYSEINKLINDISKVRDGKKEVSELRSILQRVENIYLELIQELNRIQTDIINNSYTMRTTINWGQAKKIVKILNSYLSILRRILRKKSIKINDDFNFLSNSLDIIKEANAFYSGLAGEIYPAMRIQELLQNLDENIKSKIHGLFSMGGIKLQSKDGSTYEMPVDTLIMTENTYKLSLDSSVEYIENKKTKKANFNTVSDLYNFLIYLGQKTPQKVHEVKVVVTENQNWIEFQKAAKGLMIQNKFYRKGNYNLFNLDRAHTTFSIQDLIVISNESSDYTFKTYAKRLNDFCDWYALSKERKPPLGRVAAASTDKEAKNARVYELYFNYLLSQQEVIEKLYGQSIYLFTNTFGAFNLESYFLYMAKQRISVNSFRESKGMYLLSTANVVDISRITLKLRISMNSNWAKDFVKK